MGLDGYYSQFIWNFSKIRQPITSLQNKGVEFQLTYECVDTVGYASNKGVSPTWTPN